LYAEAGADIVFIEAPQSLEELVTISQAFAGTGVYLFANLIEGGKTPCLSRSQLEELGFKVGVYALSGLFAATEAMRACFERLRAEGTTGRTEGDLSFPEFEQIIEVARYRDLEGRFTTPDKSINN
jgi:methylisocitrate lyase